MKFVHKTNEIYVLNDDGNKIVRATFPFIEDGVIVVDHTYVDPSLRGQGVASKLMHEVYNYAKEQGYSVTASCPYAVVWFKKNKDKHDILNTEIEVPESCKII